MQLAQINEIVHGHFYGDGVTVVSVSIDTRTLRPGDLYIAISGERFDGHEFVRQAQQAGACAALVQKPVDTDLPYIVVPDTRKALAELASAWRQQSGVKLVGITGSNGKTTVKEMTAAILSVNAPVLFTRGNLNNDIGVPLTLLRLESRHRFAVIEMGANHPGEIRYSAMYAKPDVALINNAGPAHIEGFGDIIGVARAKGEIVQSLHEHGVAVLNVDDPYFDYWRGLAGNRSVLSFGLSAAADVRASQIDFRVLADRFVTAFKLHLPDQVISVQIALPGQHNVVNALAAAAAATALGINALQIKQGLEQVKPVTGRLQPMPCRQGSLLIDDSYNANPASLQAALDVLLACPGEPWVVLGAFAELGSDSKTIHQKLGGLMKKAGVSRLFATGADAEYVVSQFGEGGVFFASQSSLIEMLHRQLTGDQTLLIKGSRTQQMEKVAAALT